MCLITIAYKQHQQYPFLLSANRDEFYRRPTTCADFWPEHPSLLAGRDNEAGGTWLGLTREGRFAAITNYREGPSSKDYPMSRGELTLKFLTGNLHAADFLESIHPQDQQYAGFNLLLMDNTGLYCYSNRDSQIQILKPGLYGLSNHQIDTPWPKVRLAKERLQQVLKHTKISHADLFATISDNTPVTEEELPDFNFDRDIEWAKQVSAQFVKSEDYGTRASTTILVNHEGDVQFREQNYLSCGREGATREFSFSVK